MSLEIARKLRKNPTEAEKRLLSKLRRKQVHGVRFRRQVPIGPYVVDFYCASANLVIEVDGGQHATQTHADERRTNWLADRGYLVMRFWNSDIFENLDGCLETVRDVVSDSR